MTDATADRDWGRHAARNAGRAGSLGRGDSASTGGSGDTARTAGTPDSTALERTEARLRRALYRFDCPPPHALGEYDLDLLPPVERTAIAAHVLECQHCAGELSVLRSFMRQVPDAPEPDGARSAGQRLMRVVATVLPNLVSPAYALRGDAASANKTYRASGVSVTLSPGPGATRRSVSLVGLIIAERPELLPAEGGRALLISPEGALRPAAIDQLGSFSWEDVPAGTYEVELHLANVIVALEAVEIRS